MDIDILSFFLGFLIASVISSIFILISFEIRKKRALAFSNRYKVISEALSSLKALFFRLSAHLRRLEFNYQNPNEIEKERIKKVIKGLIYIFDNVSKEMMPPTEEIALEVLEGKKSGLERKAYEDSIKFRDELRLLRQKLEKEGLERFAENYTPKRPTDVFSIKILEEETEGINIEEEIN